MEPEYRKEVDYWNGSNSDIIRTVEKRFPKAVEQTKIFAQQFKGSTARQTAHNVWKFLKSHIKYVKDDENKQIIRLPSWFIHTAEGDCKSYSLLSAAIFANLGLPVSFRYASYNKFNRIPSHVYTVINDENGKEIIVDGVWKYFDDQKPPAYQYTHPMEVISMSGIEDEVNGLGRRHHNGAFSFAKKIAFAPNRRAFRTLVSINLFGLARKLVKIKNRNPQGLKKFWTRIGGKYSELEKSMKKGYNHWAKHHHKQRINGVECCVAGDGYYDEQRHITNMSGIGAAPVIAALIAAAAPVVGAVSKLAKKSGADKTEPGEPSYDETIKRTTEIRESTPGAEASVNGLTRSIEIGEIRIGDLSIGRRRHKGSFLSRVNRLRLAPARRAFRTLISINAGGMAYKMKRASMRDEAALKAKWEKAGGKYSQLLKSINIGYKKVPKARRKSMHGIGADDAAKDQKAQGIAALATTIIKLLGGLFKKHDKNADGTQSPGESTYDKIVNVVEKAADEFGVTKKPADELIDQGKADQEAGKNDEPGKAGFSASPLLLIGGAAAILMIAGKHK